MTEIYLIRHAEAEGNYYRRSQGIYEANITPLGRRQVAALAERFKDVPLDALYSSDFIRTQSTASAITKYHPGLNLQSEHDLREIGVGIWEDQPWGNLARDWSEQLALFAQDPARYHVPGCESYTAMSDRMFAAMTKIAEENDGKTVAVFSHGTAIRAFLCRLLNIPSPEIHKIPHGDNTAVHKFRYENSVFSIEYYNDASHLSEEISTFSRQNWWRSPSGSNTDADNTSFEPLDMSTDAALYTHCYESTWQISHGNLSGFNESVYISLAKGRISQDPRLVVKMSRGDDFVGLVELDKDRGAREKAGWICLIFCEPEFRQRRLGVQLLGHAVSYFRELGYEKIRLHVSQTNQNAIDFYTHNDFKILGPVQGVGGDLWMMEMDIRPRIWYLP